MSEAQAPPTTVEDFVRRALPEVNKTLDWDEIRNRYDPEPEGNAVGLVLLETDGDGRTQIVESFALQVQEGPSINIIPYTAEQAGDPTQVFGLGDVRAVRGTALKVLNPDHDLTLQKATYQRGEVELSAANPVQRERVWLVTSAMMERISGELGDILPSAEA